MTEEHTKDEEQHHALKQNEPQAALMELHAEFAPGNFSAVVLSTH